MPVEANVNVTMGQQHNARISWKTVDAGSSEYQLLGTCLKFSSILDFSNTQAWARFLGSFGQQEVGDPLRGGQGAASIGIERS